MWPLMTWRTRVPVAIQSILAQRVNAWSFSPYYRVWGECGEDIRRYLYGSAETLRSSRPLTRTIGHFSVLRAQEAFPSAVTRQTSWGKTHAGYGQLIRCSWNFQSSELFFAVLPLSTRCTDTLTGMSSALQYTNGTALLAAAMFSAACVFAWLIE